MPTGDITITQYNLIVSVDISNQELAYSIVDLQAKILEKLSKSFTRTIESVIVNADPETSTTGNVNSDDADPVVTFASTG